MSVFDSVVGEEATLQLLLEGKSIARYGDGEFNLVRGRKSMPQKFNSKCAHELRDTLKSSREECLIGIPYIPKSMPKRRRESWSKWFPSYEKYLSKKKQYYSAFITRPDSAPNINTEGYFNRVADLWRGLDVALVFGGTRSLTPEFLLAHGARSVNPILCSYEDTYSQIDYLTEMAAKAPERRVLICAGPAGTCLAHRLCRQKQALDLGHIGMFWPGSRTLEKLKVKSEAIRASGEIKQLEDGYWWPVDYAHVEAQQTDERVAAGAARGGDALIIRHAGTGILANLVALRYERVYAIEEHPGKFGALRRNVRSDNIFIYPEDVSRYLPPHTEWLEGVPR